MKLRMLGIAFAIAFSGACFGRSSDSGQICGLPSEEPPSEPPVDACRDGTVVFGPTLSERDRGGPTVETHEFATAGEQHACVRIVTSGSDRQRVSSGTIDLDGNRVAGPNLFKQTVTTIERRRPLPAGDHELGARLRGPPD